MQSILLTIQPIVINFLMNAFKKVPAFSSINSPALKTQLRAIAWVLSIAGTLLTGYVTVGFDYVMVEALLVGTFEFVLSQGTYLLFFKK